MTNAKAAMSAHTHSSQDQPDGSQAGRADFPVMVPDAHAIGMIGVIRSLGRAGYPVHACASDSNALGLSSSFAVRHAVCPAYDDAGFLPWLRDYVAAHNIKAIVPSEGFLLAIRSQFAGYAHLLPISSDVSLVYGSLSKAAVLARLQEDPATAANLPPTILWSDGDPLPTLHELRSLGLPLFVKGDGIDDAARGENFVSREESAESALETVRTHIDSYSRILIQGFVPGVGTGAYFLVDKGEIVQEFMNRCLHEVPHTGGFCSLRDSWWHEAMIADARTKVRHLGWEGVSMLEYRWDPQTDRFWFIEINARFWAALHLALFAGVDFPTLLIDRFRGVAARGAQNFRIGLQCRYTVPFEIGYVLSRWKDKRLPVLARVGTVLGWFGRFLNPRIKSDLLFPGDRKLYWLQWRNWVKGLLGRPHPRQDHR